MFRLLQGLNVVVSSCWRVLGLLYDVLFMGRVGFEGFGFMKS